MQFEPSVIRAFMTELSLFPVQSYVRLNTGEIARVIEINRTNPLRPIVEVLFEPDGSKSTPRRIDLTMEPLLYVVSSLTENMLPENPM